MTKRRSQCARDGEHDYEWRLLMQYRGLVKSEREYLQRFPWREGDDPASFIMACQTPGCGKTFGVAHSAYRRREAERLTREMVARVKKRH